VFAATYESIRDGASPTEALLGNVNGLVADWWPAFVHSYVSGEVYGVGRDVFLDTANLSGTWSIDRATDTSANFGGVYYDLSAKLYRVHLNHGELEDSARLQVNLSGELGTPLAMQIFGVDGSSLELWGQSSGQGSAATDIPNLKSHYDAGRREILVVAVNSDVSESYLGTSSLDLDLEVVSEPEASGFNSINFGLRVDGVFRSVVNDNESESYDEHEVQPPGVIGVIEGEMTSETRFEGGYELSDGSGEVVVLFNAARDTVLSIEVVMESSTNGYLIDHHFVASGVPRSFDDDDWSYYEAEGVATCEYVDDVAYSYVSPSGDVTIDLDSYSCSSGGSFPSYLRFIFHKEGVE